MSIITVGIDLAKNVFAVHGVDDSGKAVLVKPRVARAHLLPLVAQLPACLIGMEACTGAHHWARLFRQYGHMVRLMAPKFVAPYRMSGRRGKNDAAELTGRSWGVSMQYRFDKLGQYLSGWMGYFGISEYYRPIPELDEWLRRRVRMCYWKQWRLTRTKIGHLLALGVGKRTAILTGISSKSYWHLARSQATHVGMTNDWLKAQGLASIRDLWMKAHGYA